MRIAAAVLVALLVLPVHAQSLSETVEVRVLEIEAVVLDRAGNTVDGLGRGDFEVKLDGKPAEVTNFFRVRRGGIAQSAGVPEAAAGEKVLPAVQMESRLVVVFDDFHLRQAGRKRALDALRRYVQSSSDEGMTFMILRWNGAMSVRLGPTKDRNAVLRAIEKLEREPSTLLGADTERRRIIERINEVIDQRIQPDQKAVLAQEAMVQVVHYAEEQRRKTEMTLNALSELASVVGGIAGRKVVLYVAEALPQQPGTELLAYAREAFRRNPIQGFNLQKVTGGNDLDDLRLDVTAAIKETAARAQSSGTVFSTLDPGGLRGLDQSLDTASTLGYGSMNNTFVRANDSAGLRIVAAETGGRFIGNENNLDRAIAVLTDDVSSYYSLGVRAPEGRAADIEVKVRGRDDLRVLAARRRDLRTQDEVVASAIRARLYTREQTNPLDARVFMGTAWPEAGKCVAPVHVVVPAEKLTFLPNVQGLQRGQLQIHAIALDGERESPVRSKRKPIATGAPVEDSLVFGFQPRRYVLSIAVLDGISGETSYLQTEFDATICGK
jgi:VWFA-related protein